MKITNKYNLPAPYVRAATPDGRHDDGMIHVTSLTSPPQLQRLQREHWDDLVEDVTDRLYMLDGSSRHFVLQHAGGNDGDLIEHNVRATIEGHTVTGTVDYMTADGKLYDYKNTSVWSVLEMKKSMRPEYAEQLNYYAALLRMNDFAVNEAYIVASSRDWRRSEARRSEDYPAKVEVIRVPLWEPDAAIEALGGAVREHIAETPRPCTDHERWRKDDKYAVMKAGRKSALRVLDSIGDATDWMRQNGGTSIERRPGGYVRCEDYCPVSQFCKQFNDSKGDA